MSSTEHNCPESNILVGFQSNRVLVRRDDSEWPQSPVAAGRYGISARSYRSNAFHPILGTYENRPKREIFKKLRNAKILENLKLENKIQFSDLKMKVNFGVIKWQ